MRTTPIHALLIDEDEAAELLGLAPRTLQTWRHRGEGPPYVRISSRCIRYRVADLEAWAAGLVQRSTPDDGTAGAEEAP
ncbi:MAG TPA: helix-turn-helix domain-containing protein [Vicinamibacterales bacterium]